ncbi:MAG: cytochrome c biogenesis CcdA family protein [Actinomycetota bacterium]
MIASLVQGLGEWWAPVLAFAAGVVSFASPCVCPLVPGYLAFVTGGQEREERRIFPTVLFFLGFALVFTSLGAFTSVMLPVLRSDLATRIEGAVVALFGVVMVVYALRIRVPALYAERRPLMAHVRPGPVGALPLGMAFAAGWTPCIGPVLGAILSLASAQGGALRGAGLLFFYSLGLGLPFVLIGLGIRRLVRTVGFVQRNYHWFAGVGGVLMIGIGILLATGLWQLLLSPLLRLITRFSPAI